MSKFLAVQTDAWKTHFWHMPTLLHASCAQPANEIFEGTKGGYKPLTAESRPTSVKLEDQGQEA